MKVVGKVWFDYTAGGLRIYRRVEVHAKGDERDIAKVALQLCAKDKGLEYDYYLGGAVFVEYGTELSDLSVVDGLFKDFTKYVQQEMDDVIKYINEVKRALGLKFEQEKEI